MINRENQNRNIDNIKILAYRDDSGFLSPACNKLVPCDHEMVGPVALNLHADVSVCETVIPQGTSFAAGSTEFADLVQTYKIKTSNGFMWVDKTDYDSKIGQCNGCCTQGVCNLPTGVTAGSITTTGATISFTPATGTPAAGYEWIVKTANVAPVINGTYAAGSPIVVTGLATGTAYYVFIRTICSSTNRSAWTASITFTTS